MYITKEKVLQSLFAEYKEFDRCEQRTGHNLAQAVVCITYVHTWCKYVDMLMDFQAVQKAIF